MNKITCHHGHSRELDSIMLPSMDFCACHGCYEQEKITPQNFSVSLTMFCDLRAAGASDALEDTVNYAAVYEQVATIMQGAHCNLLEHLAAKIARKLLLLEKRIEKVEVTITKRAADMGNCAIPSAVKVTRTIWDFAPTVYIGCGSNLGDKLQHLQAGLDLLKADNAVKINQVSSIYQTEPLGYAEQSDFYNLVIEAQTTYSPAQLLAVMQGIELAEGRERSFANAPRTLDLDLLLYGTEQVETATLQVPHLRLQQRAFVLIPLLEIAPHLPYTLSCEVQAQKITKIKEQVLIHESCNKH